MMRIAKRETETGRGRLAWIEAGSGWPVFLLHAYPLHAGMWRPQLERCPENCRLIAPDFRGFGSSPQGGLDAAATLDGYGQDVCAVMDALEIESACIGGLSFGGYVSLALYRSDRSRFNALVLADTRAGADTPAAAAGRQEMRECLGTHGAAALADVMLPRLLSASALRDRPDLANLVREMAQANDRRGLDRALVAMRDRPDSTSMLPHITCPTLIVVGSEDAVTPPPEASAMEGAIPRATLAVLPGAGHLSNLEQPDLFSRALEDFLRAHL